MSKKNKISREKKKNIESYLKHHGKPITRRDFIAAGMAETVAVVSMPSFVGMLTQAESALAQDKCKSEGAGGGNDTNIPVVIFDSGGGDANWIHHGINFDDKGNSIPLAAYRALGSKVDPTQSFSETAGDGTSVPLLTSPTDLGGLQLNRDLAWGKVLMEMAPELRANLTAAVFPSISNDDNGNNLHNPTQTLVRAGYIGGSSSLTAFVGTGSERTSGGKTKSANDSPLFSNFIIRNAGSAQLLAEVAGLDTVIQDPDKLSTFMKALEASTGRQLAAISEKLVPEQIKTVLDCGFRGVVEKSGTGAEGILPDEVLTSIAPFGDAGNLGSNSVESKTAAAIKLLAEKRAGVATIELGGRDYHDNTRSRGEGADEDLATLVKGTLEYFHAIGQPVIIVKISDGSVRTGGAEDGNPDFLGYFTWTSDRGETGSAGIIAYHPEGKFETTSHYVGAVSPKDGGVNRDFNKFARNDEALSYVLAANIHALHGRSAPDILKFIDNARSIEATDLASTAYVPFSKKA